MWSLAHTLERVGRSLPPTLVPEDGLARAAGVAGRLAAPLANCIYFERWLDGGPPRVDLIIHIDAESAALLAPSRSAFDDGVRSHPTWQRLWSFARDWAAPDSRLAGQVEGLWLEFDLPTDGALVEVPVPRVFVDFSREACAERSVETRLRLAVETLRPLAGGDLGSRAEDGLRACLERLPSGAFVPYVGFSPDGGGTGEAVLRVCVQGLGQALVGYLGALGWAGEADDLVVRVLTPLAEAKGDPVHSFSIVHLDLGRRILPRIGLEYPFARMSQRGGLLEETNLLEHLVSRGWCSEAVRDSLVRWPGRQVELMDHEVWPSEVDRRLSHVKVTYATGQEIHVKAYLCFSFEPMAGGTLIGTRPWAPRPRTTAEPTARQPSAIR